MTTKRETQAGDSYSQAMVYDSYNRIRRVSRDTNLVGEYDYDDQGFRVRKRSQRKVSGLENGQTVTTERWYELEYHNKYFAVERQKNMNGDSIPDTEYSINNVYLDGVRVASLEPSGAARYFLTDQVDSVKITADSSGKVVSRTEYHPYGETWFTEGVEDIAPKYNGQELDQESDFYYFNARHYDPELARFVTADVIVDGEDTTAGWNRYMYVHGNPIKYKDPTGHNNMCGGPCNFNSLRTPKKQQATNSPAPAGGGGGQAQQSAEQELQSAGGNGQQQQAAEKQKSTVINVSATATLGVGVTVTNTTVVNPEGDSKNQTSIGLTFGVGVGVSTTVTKSDNPNVSQPEATISVGAGKLAGELNFVKSDKNDKGKSEATVSVGGGVGAKVGVTATIKPLTKTIHSTDDGSSKEKSNKTDE